MNGFKIKQHWTELLLLLLTALYLIGMRSFMGPCGPKEDGSFMICHWAGQAVSGMAAVLLLLAILHLFLKEAQAKLGLSLAMIPLALLAAYTPGRLIPLCMMASMRCHSVMQPAVIVASILLCLAAILDIWVQKKRS